MAGLLTRQRKGDRADGSAAHPEGEPKKKLTRREREKRDKALRANLPSRADVSLNGIFELSGTVTFTHAVGNVPGGKFVCRHVVVQGHMMYLFEGTTRGSRPTAKPLMLLMLKRAVVTEIGVLELNPPLPPHAHVFRVEFPVRKQYGYRAFFFKCPTNLELKRWMRDLSWRVNASQAELANTFGIMRGGVVERLRSDETDTAVHPVVRCRGMSVRYKPRQLTVLEEMEVDADEEDDELAEEKKLLKAGNHVLAAVQRRKKEKKEQQEAFEVQQAREMRAKFKMQQHMAQKRTPFTYFMDTVTGRSLNKNYGGERAMHGAMHGNLGR